MTPLSVFITTYNNAATLQACLDSVRWADEIVVLDSFSSDATPDIARSAGARFAQQAFAGYGRQKQAALELTRNDWVLLLDADEALTPEAGQEIRALLAGQPACAGYSLPRQEQLFWRMNHPGVRFNHFLRLFDKRHGHIDDQPVHASPKVNGAVGRLQHAFVHYGEIDIHTKVGKINAYSSGLVADRRKRHAPRPWMMLVYPPWVFVRLYLFKRQCLNGWAGVINAGVGAFYAFLKHAKHYEDDQRRQHGRSLLPPDAPPGAWPDEPPVV